MCDGMIFPATVDEFMEQYKIVDSDHVYTNGAEMVPIFRMKQWFEHEALMKPPKSLLDHIHNVVRDEAYKRGYEQGKADTAPKWIPITEREPEEGQGILATEEPNGGWYIEVIIRTYHAKLHRKEVVAWMPLPEPWRREADV